MVNSNLEKQTAAMPNKPPSAMQGGSFSGPPKTLALNLAVFSAVQGGLTLAVKKYRGVEGKDDIPSAMVGMFGAVLWLKFTPGAAPDGVTGGTPARSLAAAE